MGTEHRFSLVGVNQQFSVCFSSWGTQLFSECGQGSLGVPKTLSESSHDDLPFSLSSRVRVKSFKSSLIGI